MKKIRYNNEDIYVDDSPFDIKNSGVINRNIDPNLEELDKTKELPVLNDDALEDTLIDLWGDNE